MRRENCFSNHPKPYSVFCLNAVVGEIMLILELNEDRLIIDSFHVSRQFRRCGIGRGCLRK
ncbi:MAG: GNAT family N-acetyltransferase [Lachnospiraceae bacterium]|nr:GNAT family N-acetyltransferase [Lachnospiraceae bacterium]